VGAMRCRPESAERDAFDAVVSVKVRATKPR
jgi:hypothetical protein